MRAAEKWATPALFALVGCALLFGAWSGFPVYDDAYLVQFLREAGAGSIAADHPDRPLYGLVLQSLAMAFGRNPIPYILIGLASWALLAWQTSRLAEKLFPEEPVPGALAALLVLAPILVETQYTTVTTSIPVMWPVSLVLAGLLLCLGAAEERVPLLIAVATLVGISAVLSEYGFLTAAACVALLLLLRRFRAALGFLAGGVAGYLLFRVISNAYARENVLPSRLLPQAFQEPGKVVTRWITEIWDALLGAWLSAAGAVRIDATSRSTLLASAMGAVAAVIAFRAFRRLPPRPAHRPPAPRLFALGTAVAAGLLLLSLASRSSTLPAYESRFATPVLPFAALFMVGLTSRIATDRYRPFLFAFLALLAGYRVVDGAFETRRRQEFLEDVGARLLPVVKRFPGITVGVLPGMGLSDGSDMTPKVTFSWNDEEARRVWVMPPSEAVELFGLRTECRDTARIETPPMLHSTGRRGPISRLIWIPVKTEASEDLEAYCAPPAALPEEGAQSRAGDLSISPPRLPESFAARR